MTEVVWKSPSVEKRMYCSEPAEQCGTSVAGAHSIRLAAKLPAAVTLPDGTEVFIRSRTAEDVGLLRKMFLRLSPETIYRRFHSPYPQLPEWMLAYLTDIDYPDRESLVAIVGAEIVGHVMWVREDSRQAEIAMVVEDQWQHRGIGRLLLFRLAFEARRRGVKVFTGAVLGENRPMLALIRAVFSEAKYDIRDGLYLLRVPLRALRPMYEPKVLDVPPEGRPKQDGARPVRG